MAANDNKPQVIYLNQVCADRIIAALKQLGLLR